MTRSKTSGTKLRIGVDTGGTFTDFVRLQADGLVVHKRSSTPLDPSVAIVAGVKYLAGEGVDCQVVHGSTVATNAVLERKGARVALVATEGFEDVLHIGRQTRPKLYDIFVPARRPLVDPTLVFGIRERLDAQGQILVPLKQAAIAKLKRALLRSGADIVAVCLLHSYANPVHERQLAEALREAGMKVCTSHEILPEYREYERWSTTVVNAFVAPIMERYLTNLEAGLQSTPSDARHNVRSKASFPLQIMQSNGGSIPAATARAQAVRTVLSGPAAGVVGAHAVAKAAGFERILSFDMGGTSTDVCLLESSIPTSTDSVIGDFPVRLPMIDIHTVGAGGGSIASLDSGGALRVGPESAGANPGPACYGQGEWLTVTDANLLLGRLDPDYFLGGRMPLNPAQSQAAAEPLARKLKLGIPELAEGVVRVANANMERALRRVSIERGHDPRDFALLAFGGAGGMHACEIARSLEIKTVIVPRFAGVLSALGMLFANVTRDYSASVLQRDDQLTYQALRQRLKPLLTTALEELAAGGFSRQRIQLEPLVDVRYVGQSYEITLPLQADFRAEFDALHQRRYSYSDPARAIEVVNVRLKAHGLIEHPKIPRARLRPAQAKADLFRSSRFEGRPRRTAFYRWKNLPPGAFGQGPCVVTGDEATAVIPPGFKFQVDACGNLILSSAK